MIVVDTSAVISVLAGRPANHDLISRIAEDADLHAPHLIDVEFLHALRGLVLAGKLSEDRAGDARTDFGDLPVVRYAHHPLADRMWALRHSMTSYDAAFVSLSEVLAVPLVTCDAHLAATKGHEAAIELFRPG